MNSNHTINNNHNNASNKIHSPYKEVYLSTFNQQKRLQLFCRTGHFLAIDSNGKVYGTRDKNNVYSK